MFKDHEIKNYQNEEVLIIYLDMNTEFAKLNSKSKTTINKEVNDYIKYKKINFKGKKIILMAGSLLIGTFLYTAPLLKNNDPVTDYNYTTNIVSMKENIEINDNSVNIKGEVEKEQIEEKQTIPDKKGTSSNNINNSSNIKKPSTSKPSSKVPTQNNSIVKPTTPNTSNSNINENTTSSKETSNNEETIKTPTFKNPVTIKRGNGSVVTLELEDYIIGVVSAEMPASFHSEALKAQAIAARTYALKTIKDGKTLTDTVSTQVYQDNEQLKAKWGSSYNTYYNKVKNAVMATEGLVMKYNGSLINAYYHSTSNGYTEDSTAVFGSYPYLKSVESPVDKNVSSYLKTVAMSYEEISNKLGIPVTSLSTIKLERNNSNRVDKIIIDDNVYGGVEFRTKLGLRSTDFELNLNTSSISITTRGYGHGVGMSQYGAHEYAKAGMSYQNILKHYYTGITIEKY